MPARRPVRLEKLWFRQNSKIFPGRKSGKSAKTTWRKFKKVSGIFVSRQKEFPKIVSKFVEIYGSRQSPLKIWQNKPAFYVLETPKAGFLDKVSSSSLKNLFLFAKQEFHLLQNLNSLFSHFSHIHSRAVPATDFSFSLSIFPSGIWFTTISDSPPLTLLA